MTQLVFDEKIVEQLESVYRSRDVLRRRRLVYEALGAAPAEQGAPEAEAWAAEQRALGARGDFYFACIQVCFSGTRPD
jgi:hypothetical protein